jgi:hypothetical protein
MATIYGYNYNRAFITTPFRKAPPGEINGKIRHIVERVTLAADAASGDVARVGKLPKNSRVVFAQLSGPDLGGTGTLLLGNAANTAASPVGTDAADDDSLLAAVDSSGQAFVVSSSSSAAQRGVKMGDPTRWTAETEIELKFSGATSGATAKSIDVLIGYILD